MNDVVWGKAVDGLALGLSSPTKNVVRLHLKNAGNKVLDVWSYVEAEEVHLDFFQLRLENGGTRELRLYDDREESASVDATLKPGETLRHDLDVEDWSGREVNGGQALPAGKYRVWATYEVKKDDGKHWRGRLEAGPANLTIAPKANAKQP